MSVSVCFELDVQLLMFADAASVEESDSSFDDGDEEEGVDEVEEEDV